MFVGVLKDIRADREITFIHGNVLGSSLGIQDLDEGSLLVYDSEAVIKQLGSILGIDIYKILNGMCGHNIQLCIYIIILL